MLRFESKNRVAIDAKDVSIFHTFTIISSFFIVLVIALIHRGRELYSLYGVIIELSDIISAKYPERSFFKMTIAITMGPKFLMVLTWYLIARSRNSNLSKYLLFTGILRTIAYAGWVCITPSDDPSDRNTMLTSYTFLTITWIFLSLQCSIKDSKSYKLRRKGIIYLSGLGAVLIWSYYQYKIHRVKRALTLFSFIQWFILIGDVLYDGITVYEFSECEIWLERVKEKKEYDLYEWDPARGVARKIGKKK